MTKLGAFAELTTAGGWVFFRCNGLGLAGFDQHVQGYPVLISNNQD